MFTIVKKEQWEVGFYDEDGVWHSKYCYHDGNDAIKKSAILNITEMMLLDKLEELHINKLC